MICSVIIPTLNEEARIEALLVSLHQIPTSLAVEIIVIDGGSQDRTVERATPFAKVVQLPTSNRGEQLAYGAHISQGELLWFLHADSKLPEKIDVFQEMVSLLRQTTCSAGFFPLYFYDSQQLFFRYLQATSNWRARRLGLIFGDQGLFVWKSTYQEVGGFDEEPLMEDWLLSRRLYRMGKFTPHSQKIGTSVRRFVTNGPWRTHIQMHYLKLLFLFGTSPEQLAQRYQQKKGQ